MPQYLPQSPSHHVFGSHSYRRAVGSRDRVTRSCFPPLALAEVSQLTLWNRSVRYFPLCPRTAASVRQRLHPAHCGCGSSCRWSVCDRTGTGYKVGQQRLRPQRVPSGRPALHPLDSKKGLGAVRIHRPDDLASRQAAAICLKGTWPRTPSIMPGAYSSRSLKQISPTNRGLLPGAPARASPATSPSASKSPNSSMCVAGSAH
jgi:hypothetical protein